MQYKRRRRRRSRRVESTGWMGLVIVSAMVIAFIFLSSLFGQIRDMENDPTYEVIHPSDSASLAASQIVETIPAETFEVSPAPIEDAGNGQKDFESEESQYPRFIHSRDWDGDDSYLLAKIAECEAGNQSVETRAKVILTVLNRVWSPQFPDSIEEVIYQKVNGVWQFSPLASGGSWWYTEPSEKSWEAVELVMTMEYDDSQGCMYFESFYNEEDLLKSWHHNYLEFLFQSEDMRFYK